MSALPKLVLETIRRDHMAYRVIRYLTKDSGLPMNWWLINGISRDLGELLSKDFDLKEKDFFPNRADAMERWVDLEGEKTLRLYYPKINEHSHVFDIGGYRGEWARLIWKLYCPHIHVFEPVPKFYQECVDNLHKDALSKSKIRINNFAIGAKTEDQVISLSDDGSSFSREFSDKVSVNVMGVLQALELFFQDHPHHSIDLMKLNIEGSEYDLLEALLEDEVYPKRVRNYQIQFHSFVTNCEKRRDKIHDILSKTHRLTFCFPFVWENWEAIE